MGQYRFGSLSRRAVDSSVILFTVSAKGKTTGTTVSDCHQIRVRIRVSCRVRVAVRFLFSTSITSSSSHHMEKTEGIYLFYAGMDAGTMWGVTVSGTSGISDKPYR